MSFPSRGIPRLRQVLADAEIEADDHDIGSDPFLMAVAEALQRGCVCTIDEAGFYLTKAGGEGPLFVVLMREYARDPEGTAVHLRWKLWHEERDEGSSQNAPTQEWPGWALQGPYFTSGGNDIAACSG